MNAGFLQKRKVTGGALLLIDALFFGLTDPRQAALGYIITAFVLLGLSILWAMYNLCSVASWYGFAIKRQRRVILMVSGGVSTLVALQSVGQLSGRDMAVLLPLVAVSYFYVSYGQRRWQ